MPTADELIGTEVALALRRVLVAAAPSRPWSALEGACQHLDGLTLRGRVDLLADALDSDVPGTYAELADLIRTASDGTPPLEGWMIWPVTEALARRAVAADAVAGDFDDAMHVLASLTPRLTAEFAIRILLRANVSQALRIAQTWVHSADPHVRRLASEGTRPFLPWAMRVPELTAQPGLTIPILDALHNDDSEYVRRSVANHLNDLSRGAPELVIATSARWLRERTPATVWVVRHGLRTLVKNGDANALALLGFTGTDLTVDNLEVHTPNVNYPGVLRFSTTLTNNGSQPARVAIDYVIRHRGAHGGQRPKTFKLATRTLAPQEQIDITREHAFRPITTRRYYSGAHSVALQINGTTTDPVEFALVGV